MASGINALVVPYDSGNQALRMGAGPTRLVASGIFESLQNRHTLTEYSAPPGVCGEVASAFDIQRWLAAQVHAACEGGAFPLVLAGNCMSAVGVVAGLRSRSRQALGVCWFDAHADFNTPETTVSGFLDGMALATLTGRCWTHITRSVPDFRPALDDGVMMFGTRDVDPLERNALSASGIHWPRAIENRWSAETLLDTADLAPETLAEFRTRVEEVYLHIDLDVLDIGEACANQFACTGGFSAAQLVDHVSMIATHFRIGAAAITAYDPACDPEGRIPPIVRDIVETIASTHTQT